MLTSALIQDHQVLVFKEVCSIRLSHKIKKKKKEVFFNRNHLTDEFLAVNKRIQFPDAMISLQYLTFTARIRECYQCISIQFTNSFLV